MPSPSDKVKLSRFLGMVKYHGRFLKDVSNKAELLLKMTHDDAEFEWHMKSVQRVKTSCNTITEFLKIVFASKRFDQYICGKIM